MSEIGDKENNKCVFQEHRVSVVGWRQAQGLSPSQFNMFCDGWRSPVRGGHSLTEWTSEIKIFFLLLQQICSCSSFCTYSRWSYCPWFRFPNDVTAFSSELRISRTDDKGTSVSHALCWYHQCHLNFPHLSLVMLAAESSRAVIQHVTVLVGLWKKIVQAEVVIRWWFKWNLGGATTCGAKLTWQRHRFFFKSMDGVAS